MVAPHIIVFYSSTWKCIIRSEGPNEKELVNFIKALPILRDYLSCAVCRQLLVGFPLYSVELCDHYVCKGCKGADREEKQFCGNCRDWEDFSEDETLVALLAGHSRYCRIFLRSSDCRRLLEQKQISDPLIDAFRILDILQEGAKVEGKTKRTANTVRKQDNINPRLQLSHVGELKNVVIESRGGSSSGSEGCSINSSGGEVCQVQNNVDHFSSVTCSSSSGFNHVHNSRKVEDKLVQMILDKDHEESIDIKIEPVYQKQSDLDDDDMESDSPDSGNSRDVNCIDKDGEMSSEDNEMDEVEDDDAMPVEMNDEEAEEYSGSVTIQPTSSIPLSIPSSLNQQPQQQVIYAQATSVPQRMSPNVSVSSSPVMQFSPRQFHSFVLTRPVATVSSPGMPHNQGLSTRVRLPSGQTIRLALPDGRPVTMVRQVMNNHGPVGGIRHITFPISASDLIQKKIIVRPAGGISGSSTSATATQLQRWPDANAVLQYASGSGTVSQASHGQGAHTVTVSQSQNSTRPNAIASTSSSNVVIATNAQSRPRQYTASVIYSGGAVVNHVSESNSPSPSTTATFTDASGNVIGTTISLPEALRNTVKVRIPNKNKMSSKVRSGCRCGNAASQPSKLTCCGQRCICYVDGKSCIDCKCRGCNNPYIPGGKKLLQGLNTVIDTKTNRTSVPMMMSHSGSIMASVGSVGNIASSMNFVASSSNSGTIVTNVNNAVSSPSPSTMNLVPMIPSTTTSMAPQIFTRIHHPGTPQPTTTTFSQIIPVANFAGQFGQFTIPLPISLISPANTGHNIQSHSDTIHLQNIQLNPSLNLQNHNQ